MKKNILIFGLFMLLSMINVFGQGIEVDGIYYIFTGTTAEVTSHPSHGYSGDIVIPSAVTYNGVDYNVKKIGNYAFKDCSYLTSVFISDGVTSIGWGAFSECINLVSIKIPEGVKTIESGVFLNCYSLTSITIPNSVTTINNIAFYFCGSLTSVAIPRNVTYMESNVFIGCMALSSINVESENTCFSSDDGIIFNKSKTQLICYPAGKKENNYTIPNTVSIIGDNAFRFCRNLISIDIPSNVSTIDFAAFADCSHLTSIVIPNGVTRIASGTFEFCTRLTSIAIPNSVTKIGSFAFADCWELATIDIPDSVTTIEESAFLRCRSLTSIDIPNGVTLLNDTFPGCTSLTTVVIPSSVSSIVRYAFSGCTSLTSLTNLNPVPVSIDTDVFSGIDLSACTLYVPVGSGLAYKNTDVWKEFNVVEIGSAIEPIETASFKIFPNPTTGKVHIETESNIKVLNLQGELLLETFGNQVDLSDYPQGVYLLQVNGRRSKVVKN